VTVPLEPSSAYADANGVRLHYLAWQRVSGGNAGLPPLVLVHATGFLARLWQPIAGALSSEYTVYAYDTRGHGDSEKPDPAEDANYHWSRLAGDLRGFLDALGIRQAPVIGHSAGGAAAAYIAGTAPGYVSKLVLIEPIIMPGGFNPDTGRRNEMAEGARKRRLVWDSPAEMAAAYRSREVFANWRDDVLLLYAEHGLYQREDGRFELKCPGEIEAAIFEHSASLNVWGVLPNITCPTLVLRGERTEEFTAMAAISAAQHIPGAIPDVIPGAGHLAPMERPGIVARMARGFLAGG
jgi:pimeloyl-ACP methyl ester carboxylesterase